MDKVQTNKPEKLFDKLMFIKFKLEWSMMQKKFTMEFRNN